MALSPDGQWMVGIGPDNAFCIWDDATLTAECVDERLPIRGQTVIRTPDSTAVQRTRNACHVT